MARSLPENTVDAWTAIKLSRIGARWIWLPTTNESGLGRHPGDASAIVGGRLVVIENKGIETPKEGSAKAGSDSIQFGKKPSQREKLRGLEQAGLTRVARHERPLLGWVFYGLPIAEHRLTGAEWKAFPGSHLLACPHTLDSWGVGLRSLSALRLRRLCADTPHLHDSPASAAPPPMPFTLQLLRRELSKGRAGLPLLDDEVEVLELLAELTAGARGEHLSDDMRRRLDNRIVADVLHEFGSAVRTIGQHITVLIV